MIELSLTNTLQTSISTFFDQPTSSIIAGMTYGIKSGLDNQIYKDIKSAGLSHLIVFSGSNIVIIYSIILQAIFFVKSKIKKLIASVLMIGFLLLLPKEPTILRASIMWGFSVFSSLIDRRVNKIYTLLLTVIAMIFADPPIITNISFQLSISAILGILVFNDIDAAKNKNGILNNIKNDLKTTISAQVFTIPIIYFYFNEFNFLSPISNLLAAPIIRPIMYIGLVVPIIHLLAIKEALLITIYGNTIVYIFLFVVNIFS